MLGVGFSLIGSNTVATPPVVNLMRTGTNLNSMESVTYDEYDPASGPPTGDYPIYTTTLLNWFQSEGVAHVRFPVAWEALQSSLGGNIPSSGSKYLAYWNNYINTINALLARNIAVTINLFGYNAAVGNTDIAYQGGSFAPSDFGNFWGPMASAVNTATGNSQLVSFDLINEPHSGTVVAGGGVSQWTPYCQAAITAIRATGATNRIYYEPYNFSDPAGFVTDGSATEFLKLKDPVGNLAISIHNYYGNGVGQNFGNNPGNANSTTALSDAMANIVTWSRANGNIIINIGEIAVDAGQPNGSHSIAVNQWANWQSFCLANKDIIDGWSWWGCSEYEWWPTSDSSQGANWALNTGNDTTASVYMGIIQTTLGSF